MTLVISKICYVNIKSNYTFNFFSGLQPQHKPTPTPYHDWDYLMFSQRWPITSCAQWEEAKSSNTCNFPSDKSQWTIHGIWPTKTGTEGPLFCPSALHFDPNQLQPIMDDLNNQWTNVEANTKQFTFWKHEWDKHGTCASVEPEMNSVINYFKQGLEWNKQYRLSDILGQSKIFPGKAGYTPQQISDGVKSVTKTNPIVQCVTDKHTKESMISEIRICFNKSLELIDCDHTSPSNNFLSDSIISNCNHKKEVMYYAEVPAKDFSYEMDYIDDVFRKHFEDQMFYFKHFEENYYLKLYRFLRFLIWFTT